MKTVLSHANLIDCVEPKVRPDSAVLIEDGRIRAILPSEEAGSLGDAQMIDLKGRYLMPASGRAHPSRLPFPRRDAARRSGDPAGSRPRLPNPASSDCAAPAPITLRTSHGSGPSSADSMPAVRCSPAVHSSPPRADIS